MLEKIKNFFTKYGIIAYTGLIVLLAILIIVICSVVSFGKANLKNISDKVENIIDKSKDKIVDIKTKEVANEIEKKVALEKEEEKKQEIVKKLDEISNITPKKKRVDELIRLNKSIKVNL